MGWEGVNRRKFPRANYKCLVTVRRKSGTETFTTQTQNIGPGGICIVLPERLDIFSNVDLVITFVDGVPPLKCGGSVVWTVKSSDPRKAKINCYDTGIEFVNFSEESASRLKKLVEDLSGKQGAE